MWRAIFSTLRNIFSKEMILKFIKDKLFSSVIIKLLGNAAGGIKLFLLKLGLEKLWKDLIKPSLTKLIRYFQKEAREKEYREIAKEAVDADNKDDRRKHIDNLLD